MDGDTLLTSSSSNSVATPAPSTEQNDTVAVQGVEGAMGGVMDQLQAQLGFPTDDTAKKPSEVLTYAVSAHSSFFLKQEWEIMRGFKLRGVKLKAKMGKISGEPAWFGFELSAHFTVKDVKVLVTGTIPRLQGGKPVEFTLSLTVADLVDAMDTRGLLELCADNQLEMKSCELLPILWCYAVVTSATATLNAGYKLLNSTKSIQETADAVAASITVVKSCGSNNFFLKSFQIFVSKNMNWDLVPGKVRLSRAAASLVFKRQKAADCFDAYLGVDGKLVAPGTGTLVNARTRLTLEGDDIFVALACDIGPSACLNGSEAMDLISGEPLAEKALTSATVRQPQLPDPGQLTRGFDGLAIFQFTDSNWRLNQARVSLYHRLMWSPVRGVELVELKFVVSAVRRGVTPGLRDKVLANLTLLEPEDGNKKSPDLDVDLAVIPAPRPAPTTDNSLAYAVKFAGLVRLANMNLMAIVEYLSETNTTRLHCRLNDGTFHSIAEVATDPAFFSSLPGEGRAREADFETQLKTSTLPSSCPVELNWAFLPATGTDRRLTLTFHEARLSRLTFSASFSRDKEAWQLSDTVKLQDLGIWVDYVPTPVSTSETPAADDRPTPGISRPPVDLPANNTTPPSSPVVPILSRFGILRGFAYGHLFLSSGIRIFGFAAGKVDSSSSEFVIGLSASSRPGVPLGIAPKTLFMDTAFPALDPVTEGWELPSTLDAGAEHRDNAASAVFKSTTASVFVRCFQRKLHAVEGQDNQEDKYDTGLLYAIASVSLQGDWQVFSGLLLKQLSMRAVMFPGNEPRSTRIEVRGVMDTRISGLGARLGLRALFAKVGSVSSFTATFTASGDTCDVDSGETETLPLSPSAIMGLSAFGGTTVGEIPNNQVPDNFPVKPAEMLQSTKAKCEFEVSKSADEPEWKLSKVNFSMGSVGAWDTPIIPGKITAHGATLNISVLNPRDVAKRDILANAATTIRVGNIVVYAEVTVRHEDGFKYLALDFKARGTELHTMVTSLAGESLDRLSPAETPPLTDGPLLAAQILCVSEAPTEGDSAGPKYRLAAMSISYQLGTTMTLQPFTVTRMSLLLAWEATTLRVGFKGEVQCGSVPVDISLQYDGAKPDRLDFVMEPRKGNPVRILDVSTLPRGGGHHLPAPTYAVPQGVNRFDELQMTGIRGVFRVKLVASPTSSSTRLLELDAHVTSNQILTVLEFPGDGSSGKALKLREFGLHWKYRYDTESEMGVSTGHVFALLAIQQTTVSEVSETDSKLNSDIHVQFERDGAGQEVFSGRLVIDASLTKNAVDCMDVLTQLVPSHTYKIPGNINLPGAIPLVDIWARVVRGKSVEIRASGHELWSCALDNTHTTVKLDKLGLRFKAEKVTEGNQSVTSSTVMEGSLTGALSFANFESTDEVRADLCIGNTSNSVLRARIRRKPASKTASTEGDLAQLTTELSATPLSDVSADVSPILSFDEDMPLYIQIDFSNTSQVSVLLAGKAAGIGECVFFTRVQPQTRVREYIVSLSVSSLSSIFNDTANGRTGGEPDFLWSSFDLAPIGVHIFSYDGTVHDLIKDIDACAATVMVPAGMNSNSTTSSQRNPPPIMTKNLITPALTTAPPDGQLDKGAWFFAGVNFNGRSKMTRALVSTTKPNHVPSLAIYGKVSSTTKELCVAIKDLYILDDYLVISGSGRYFIDESITPGKQAIKLAGKLTLLGLAKPGTPPPVLDVAVHIDDTVSRFSVENTGQSLAEINDPFGDMFNIHLSLTSLDGTVEHRCSAATASTNTSFSLTAVARFNAEESSPTLAAEVIFSNALPQVVCVWFRRLAMQGEDGLFAKVITPNPPGGGSSPPGTWPACYPASLHLENGVLYYAKRDTINVTAGPDAVTRYLAGYHAAADLTVFGARLRVTVDIPSNRKGVKIAGTTSSPIILCPFFRLLNLTIAVDSTHSDNTTFSLSGDAEFFELSGLRISLGYIPPPHNGGGGGGEGTYEGSLSYKRNEQEMRVTILYRNCQFGIDNWSLPDPVGSIFKLDEAIAKASELFRTCGCEALVGLVFDTIVTTKFSWKIARPAEGSGKPLFRDGVLHGRIVWSYDVILPVGTSPVLDLAMPDIPIALAGPFELRKIDEMLLNTVRENAAQIGQAVMDRPCALAKIIGVVAVDKFTPKLVAALLCRNVNPPNLMQHAQNLTGQLSNTACGSFNQAADALGNAGGGTAASAAATSALGAIGGGFTSALGFIAGGLTAMVAGAKALDSLRHLVSKLGSNGSDSDANNHNAALQHPIARAEEQAAIAQAKFDAMRSALETALVLNGEPKFERYIREMPDGGGGVDMAKVDWAGVSVPEHVSAADRATGPEWTLLWEVKIVGAGGDPMLHGSRPGPRETVLNIPLVTDPSATARVRALLRFVHEEKIYDFVGPWSNEGKATWVETPLFQPSNVVIWAETTWVPAACCVKFTAPVIGWYQVAIVPSEDPTFHARLTESTVRSSLCATSKTMVMVCFNPYMLRMDTADTCRDKKVRAIVRQIAMREGFPLRSHSDWVLSTSEVKIDTFGLFDSNEVLSSSGSQTDSSQQIDSAEVPSSSGPQTDSSQQIDSDETHLVSESEAESSSQIDSDEDLSSPEVETDIFPRSDSDEVHWVSESEADSSQQIDPLATHSSRGSRFRILEYDVAVEVEVNLEALFEMGMAAYRWAVIRAGGEAQE
ncbi:hypothetical protein F5144DRAFT_598684 [Chaetomium tenue]|uniref:Uncharacterized protein n=1 Tax=Chaetomium tenue TaxID=1854479 RepID=A0ACB7PQ95_9PEZI|nr:hypothetical protein F5144DRAFT_598684 [Chaetomium globosum]